MWEELCANANGADLFIMAGDAFHRRRPTPAEMSAFRSGLDRLTDTPVVAIPGNHDVIAGDEPNALTVFERDLMLATKPCVVPIPRIETDLALLPWTPPQYFRATMNPEMAGDVNSEVSYLLEQVVQGLAAQCTLRHRLLVLHWSLRGSLLPNGKPVADLREPMLGVDQFAALGFTGVAAGHIHQPQFLGGDIPVGYTGSPWLVDWGEANSRHGWIEADTDEGSLRLRHVENTFEALYVPLNIDMIAAAENAAGPVDILEMIGRFPGDIDGAIVRLRYRCTAEQRTRVDEQQVRAMLADMGAQRVYSVAAQVERTVRAREEDVDESLEPLQALLRWCESTHDVTAAMVAPLVQKAEGYVEALR